MNFQRSSRENKKMASCGLEAVKEPLEESASLDSSRDNRNVF